MREFAVLPQGDRWMRYRALRILQPSPETPSHSNAQGKTMAGVSNADNCHTMTAKAVSPTAPRAAPAASSAAASRPRTMPRKPADFFFCVSCFSTSVALAGKIAGKARKRPPTTGPLRCAIRPAAAVISPPKTNLMAYSCHPDGHLSDPSCEGEGDS